MSGPKTFVWPNFPDETRLSVIKQVVGTFEKIGFYRPEMNKKRLEFLEKRKRKLEEKGAQITEKESEALKRTKERYEKNLLLSERSYWSAYAKTLAIGINKTARGLEKDQLSLIIVDESCTPG